MNVDVAVDTNRGLLVAVLRHAEEKNMTQIALDVLRRAEKVRYRRLSLEDMSGGGIGGTCFSPVVNWPEVVALGVSRGSAGSMWRADTFEPKQLLPLSFSDDRRVIDDVNAAGFLCRMVKAIEQPFLLSLLD